MLLPPHSLLQVILVLGSIQAECAAFTSSPGSATVLRLPKLRAQFAQEPASEPSHLHHQYRSLFPAEISKPSLKSTRLHLAVDPSEAESNDDNSSSGSSAASSVASQAALIAGTTIGGGFLALPTATAPCGAAPAAVGLIGVWLYLLVGALSLSDAIFMMKSNDDAAADDDDDDDESMESKSARQSQTKKDISLFSLVQGCFGNVAGILAGLLFLLLIKVTLIAQLSKVGVLLEGALPGVMGRQLWTAFFSIAITAVCLVGKQRKIERINDVLTSTMLVSFAALVALAGVSGWSIDGLLRADYKSLLPSFSSSSAIGIGGGGPWAIPIFVQLLIYNEVVPLVASRLGDRRKVRQAILVGSSVPLLMCLVWSCVALGLVPYDPSSMTPGMIYDPLVNLGDAVLSKGGSVGRVFLASVNMLAGSAICTTVIGSILASTQYFDDIITSLIGRVRSKIGGKDDDATATNSASNDAEDTDQAQHEDNSTKQTVFPKKFKYQKLLTHTLAVAPSAVIALYGSSDLYFRATSFAGEFPCTLLYGLIPPLCNLRLLWKHSKNEDNDVVVAVQWKYVVMQMVLALISIGIIAASSISK